MGLVTSQGYFILVNGRWVAATNPNDYHGCLVAPFRVFPADCAVNKNGLPIVTPLLEAYGERLSAVLSTERVIFRYVKIVAVSTLSDLLKSRGSFQEKYDGSTLTVCSTKSGKISITHQGRPVTFDCPIFGPAAVGWAVRYLKYPQLFDDNEVITCEVLCRKRQNKLTYARVPRDFCIIIDLLYKDSKTYATQSALITRANEFGYMPARVIYTSDGTNDAKANATITTLQHKVYEALFHSELGGTMIEGLVWKGEDGTKRKFVRKDFREEKEQLPENTDMILSIASKYNELPRWEKGLQRLRQRDSLASFSIKDMPKLLPTLKQELDEDLIAEKKEHILAMLSDDLDEQTTLWIQNKEKILKSSRAGLEHWLRTQLVAKYTSGA
ncbi:MAG: hypothetical protein Hyperionvirus16_20 [Hyperionvirus sp.]|uniref:Uncharacterized protein n=1 Tax=Hyperionvirus sp. TaxID=2487770 RepID=A0A3G5A9Y5_9VIRU|nr:MAG: hypothetical protein Hyperionvirus16_20 [Hyperionvirus sp.]